MKFLYIIILLSISAKAFSSDGADSTRLILKEVVSLAKDNSIAAKQAVTTRETKYWQWRTYKSNYQPQLSLNGNLPGYSKTSSPVVQPDGTIVFQPIHYDNSSLTLNFSQSITATGATIYGQTQMQRFNDFNKNSVSNFTILFI
jgi:outer membrane protein